ncbi:MAG: hypothetical protein JEY79_14005 [Pseudodesulfovibrio sp.]|nr:hypothetical protein [Pseudodesulfovibrio sp.]
MAVNKAGTRLAREIAWWVTYHPVTMLSEAWTDTRYQMGGNNDFTLITHRNNVYFDRRYEHVEIFQGPSQTGSSTLLGVLFGLDHGYRRIIVAGAPLDGDYSTFRDGWIQSSGKLKGRVTSMSGWTKDFLEGLQ